MTKENRKRKVGIKIASTATVGSLLFADAANVGRVMAELVTDTTTPPVPTLVEETKSESGLPVVDEITEKKEKEETEDLSEESGESAGGLAPVNVESTLVLPRVPVEFAPLDASTEWEGRNRWPAANVGTVVRNGSEVTFQNITYTDSNFPSGQFNPTGPPRENWEVRIDIYDDEGAFVSTYMADFTYQSAVGGNIVLTISNLAESAEGSARIFFRYTGSGGGGPAYNPTGNSFQFSGYVNIPPVHQSIMDFVDKGIVDWKWVDDPSYDAIFELAESRKPTLDLSSFREELGAFDLSHYISKIRFATLEIGKNNSIVYTLNQEQLEKDLEALNLTDSSGTRVHLTVPPYHDFFERGEVRALPQAKLDESQITKGAVDWKWVNDPLIATVLQDRNPKLYFEIEGKTPISVELTPDFFKTDSIQFSDTSSTGSKPINHILNIEKLKNHLRTISEIENLQLDFPSGLVNGGLFEDGKVYALPVLNITEADIIRGTVKDKWVGDDLAAEVVTPAELKIKITGLPPIFENGILEFQNVILTEFLNNPKFESTATAGKDVKISYEQLDLEKLEFALLENIRVQHPDLIERMKFDLSGLKNYLTTGLYQDGVVKELQTFNFSENLVRGTVPAKRQGTTVGLEKSEILTWPSLDVASLTGESSQETLNMQDFIKDIEYQTTDILGEQPILYTFDTEALLEELIQLNNNEPLTLINDSAVQSESSETKLSGLFYDGLVYNLSQEELEKLEILERATITREFDATVFAEQKCLKMIKQKQHLAM